MCEILSFRLICLSFLENLLEFVSAWVFFEMAKKKPALDCISRVYIKAEDFLSFRTLSALFVLITLLGQFYFPQSMSNNKKPHWLELWPLNRVSFQAHSKYKRPSSSDSKTWYEKHRSIAMFERGNLEEVDNVVATEYDDCDVTVTTSNGDIDEQIRKIGFQVSSVV